MVLKEGGIYEGFNDRIEQWGNYPCLIYPQFISYPWAYEVPANALEWAVRFTIDVVPKDGSSPCTITKTFNLNPVYNVIDDSEIVGFDVEPVKNKMNKVKHRLSLLFALLICFLLLVVKMIMQWKEKYILHLKIVRQICISQSIPRVMNKFLFMMKF